MSALRSVLRLDEALFRRCGAWRPAGVVRSMRALTHLGDAPSWVVVGLFLICCGGAGVRYGSLVGAGALIATVLSQSLKRVCCRPRPSTQLVGFVALVENPDAFSFPSGHSAAAFAVAVALAGEGHSLGNLALVLASCIAISRVYLGAHYPLDVMMGALLGAGAGGLARMLVS